MCAANGRRQAGLRRAADPHWFRLWPLCSWFVTVLLWVVGCPKHNHPTLRRAGGGIKPGQRVNVSFDMLGGMVGEIGDGAHVNSFADPDYYTGMESVVKWVLDRLGGCCMLAWIVTFGTCCRPGFWFAGATPPGGR